MSNSTKPYSALQLRAIYSALTVVTIILGLLSRHFTTIPLWIGSALWGLMVYFIVRFLLIRSTVVKAATISLLFSYAIEFWQLYQAPWINHIRQTLFGRLVLGQGFEWGDLVSYTVGIGVGVLWDRVVMKSK
jgi:hypothetical protein